MWGGVRRDDLTYIWLDLQQFAEVDRLRPTADDHSAFEQLLAALPAGTTASKAAGQAWAGIPSNKAERDVLLDVLGVCSVLESPEHTGYVHHLVRAADRVLPPYRNVDRAYPVCWWRGVRRESISGGTSRPPTHVGAHSEPSLGGPLWDTHG